MRPDNSIANLEFKSVRKKLKDGAFARAINRDTIMAGAAMLELDLQEHTEFVIKALAEGFEK